MIKIINAGTYAAIKMANPPIAATPSYMIIISPAFSGSLLEEFSTNQANCSFKLNGTSQATRMLLITINIPIIIVLLLLLI